MTSDIEQDDFLVRDHKAIDADSVYLQGLESIVGIQIFRYPILTIRFGHQESCASGEIPLAVLVFQEFSSARHI